MLLLPKFSPGSGVLPLPGPGSLLRGLSALPLCDWGRLVGATAAPSAPHHHCTSTSHFTPAQRRTGRTAAMRGKQQALLSPEHERHRVEVGHAAHAFGMQGACGGDGTSSWVEYLHAGIQRTGHQAHLRNVEQLRHPPRVLSVQQHTVFPLFQHPLFLEHRGRAAQQPYGASSCAKCKLVVVRGFVMARWHCSQAQRWTNAGWGQETAPKPQIAGFVRPVRVQVGQQDVENSEGTIHRRHCQALLSARAQLYSVSGPRRAAVESCGLLDLRGGPVADGLQGPAIGSPHSHGAVFACCGKFAAPGQGQHLGGRPAVLARTPLLAPVVLQAVVCGDKTNWGMGWLISYGTCPPPDESHCLHQALQSQNWAGWSPLCLQHRACRASRLGMEGKRAQCRRPVGRASAVALCLPCICTRIGGPRWEVVSGQVGKTGKIVVLFF